MKLVCLLAGVLLAAALNVRAEDAKLGSLNDYARWIKPWTGHASNSERLGNLGLKVVITTVSGEQPLAVVTNMTPLERLNLAYHLRTVGTEITTNGLCWSYFASNTDSQSAPVRQLSADELQQLDALLAQLPDDQLTLPPPGKRVVVQVLEQGRWRVRVYDQNQAPAEIVSLLKLTANPFEKSL